MSGLNKIPRSADDDYSPEIVEQRQQFIEQQTGAELNHTKRFSFDPHEMESNIENFWGVAQIPVGVAGPLWWTPARDEELMELGMKKLEVRG